MYALMLLAVLAVVANSVWLARMNYRLFVVEARIDADGVPELDGSEVADD